ncbi:MAG: DUF115 domain-containing protein [Spirochaetaceae bacterium]|jgi:hypothetical protein|nr:DUF115 domain-containing protein [Spirochaetaceae bacterium]
MQNNSLHSSYNPLKEAERFLASLNVQGEKVFILVEPGENYLYEILHKSYPLSKIITLHADPVYHKGKENEWSLNNHEQITLQSFLEHSIPDMAASDIRLIEWLPALKVYSTEILSITETTVQYIKRIDANYRTEKAFSKRWEANRKRNLPFCNAVNKSSLANYYNNPNGLIVCAAGPQLELALPDIQKLHEKEGIALLAVSSALPFLVQQSIYPEIILTTDGGFWANLHMAELYREIAHAKAQRCKEEKGARHLFCPLLVATLHATIPTQVLEMAAGEGCLAFADLPMRGTVAASALDLAMQFTDGSIYIAGFSFENEDIKTHCSPYAFESYIRKGCNRLKPYYSEMYTRTEAINAGNSLSVYAEWFASHLGLYQGRIVSLPGNNALFSK